MKNLRNSRGFTLIELLVVVLIIGILSAVALPQYEKAVAKSRATEAKMVAKAVMDGEQIYYMENFDYADPQDLDIKVDPNSMKNFTFSMRNKSRTNGVSFDMSPRGLGSGTTWLHFSMGTNGVRDAYCSGSHCNMYFTSVGSCGYKIW